MNDQNETHLGDGLYARHDGYSFWLRATRGHEDHVVALEPAVMESFMDFVSKTLNLKIEVTKND